MGIAIVEHPKFQLPLMQDSSVAAAPNSDTDEQTVLRHLPQVRLVAQRIRRRMPPAVDLDDLIGYGTLGLMRAVQRFDPNRGILLTTYAEHRIRGAILDGLRAMDWLPRSARLKLRLAQEENDGQIAANSEQTAKEKTPLDATSHQKRSRTDVGRMEAVISYGGLQELEQLAKLNRSKRPDENSTSSPEALYNRKELLARMAQALSHLPSRERRILDLYYKQGLNMKDISQRLGVHPTRVSQLHRAALLRLQRQCVPQSRNGKRIHEQPA